MPGAHHWQSTVNLCSHLEGHLRSWGHAGAMVGGSGSAAWGWMVRPSWGVVEWFVSILPVTIGAPTVTQ